MGRNHWSREGLGSSMSDRTSEGYYAQYAGRPRRRKKRSRAPLVLFILLLIVVVCAILATVLNPAVTEKVTLEAGDPVTMGLFMKSSPQDGKFVTDVAAIDTSVPGVYAVIIEYDGKTYDCSLTIEDTTPPSGVTVPMTVPLGAELDPYKCVADVRDVTEVTVYFKSTPDLTVSGEHRETVVLMDTSGNKTELPVTVTVLADTVPPVISGTHDIEAFVGGSIQYREGVTVTDDQAPYIINDYEVDSTKVNVNKPGSYEVTYRAADAAGNTTEVTVTVTITEKLAGYDEVMAEARDVLAQITTSSMDDMDVAYAIYRWALYNIAYVDTSDKSSWTIGAHQAFTQRSGDCFVYFAACKALLTAAGIENMDIVKSDTSHSRHYWNLINLGDGWYHLDATPRKGTGDNFFMVTDAELEAYSKAHNDSHIFNSDDYPERATKSLQNLVDYNSPTLKR